MAAKFLVSGDARGRHELLFERARAVNEKHGPFQALLCVGNFFGESHQALVPYITGEKKIPLPTYFICGSESSAQLVDKIPNGGQIVENLTYLGRFGVRTIGGVKVAYLSGMLDAKAFSVSQPLPERATQYATAYNRHDLRAKVDYRDIDILLTTEWGRGFHNLFDALPSHPKGAPEAAKCPTIGSQVVAKLVQKCCPQYHFAGAEDHFFQLPPFGTARGHSSRFIALGQWQGENGQRSIYACGMQPLSGMGQAQRVGLAKPDATPCPYAQQLVRKLKDRATADDTLSRDLLQKRRFEEIAARDKTGATDHRWSKAPPNKKRRVTQKVQRDECWFCPASKNFSQYLLISMSEHAYVSLAKGGVVKQHLQIVPVRHVPNIYELDKNERDDIEHYLEALYKCFQEQRPQQTLVVFERNIGNAAGERHCFVEAVVCSPEEAGRLGDVITTEASMAGITFLPIGEEEDIEEHLEGDGYLLIYEYGKARFIHRARRRGRRVPFTFLRKTVAMMIDPRSADRREDWRKCKLQKEEEIAVIDDIKAKFQRFDFALNADVGGAESTSVRDSIPLDMQKQLWEVGT